MRMRLNARSDFVGSCSVPFDVRLRFAELPLEDALPLLHDVVEERLAQLALIISSFCVDRLSWQPALKL